MEIIKRGKIPENDWIGKILTCGKCGTKFRLQTSDENKIEFVRWKNVRQKDRNIYCPTCGCSIRF